MRSKIMKKFAFVLLSLLMAVSLFATGESEKTYELTVVTSGSYSWEYAPGYFDTGGFDSPQDLIHAEFEEKHNVKINYVIRDVTQGSMTVDALIEKNEWPDVWIDATGYFKDYLNAEDSLPLEEYMDVNVFQDWLIEPYTSNGHVYAIPVVNIGTGMVINTDMLDEIGYTLPDMKDWTIDEYIRLAKKLKANGQYVTTVATMKGFNAWMYPWIFAFGGELFADGDYSKVAINTPESRRALEFMKMLVEDGYAVPYPNEVDDNKTVELFTTGKIFGAMMQNGHTDYWVPEQVKNGVLEEAFDYTFIQFPHVPEIEATPVFGYQTVVNVHRSDDETRNKLAAELAAEYLSVRWHDYATTLSGGFPVRKGYKSPNVGTAAKPSFRAVEEVVAASGLMDLGGLNPRTREARDAALIPIQRFADGDISAQEFLDQFEAEANAMLAK
jgi:ABC-type glycerol-3-phosphate transport system substrate-binding protein